jgi:hypothetical protein
MGSADLYLHIDLLLKLEGLGLAREWDLGLLGLGLELKGMPHLYPCYLCCCYLFHPWLLKLNSYS